MLTATQTALKDYNVAIQSIELDENGIPDETRFISATGTSAQEVADNIFKYHLDNPTAWILTEVKEIGDDYEL